LSSPVAEYEVRQEEPRAGTPAGYARALSALRAVLIVLAPPIAVLAALLLHRLLPNKQLAPPTHLYPLLLEIFLAAMALLVLLQWIWQPLQTWVSYNGPRLAGFFALLAFWDFITLKMAWMPLPYFPGPDMVFQGMLNDRGILLESTFYSLRLLMTGYVAGVLAGVTAGVLIGWFGSARYWAMPMIKFIGPIPATALVPLAMVLFTNSFFSGAALIAWGVWFPVTMLTASGIANVPVSYLDVARTLGGGRAYLIFRVAIPSALPTIFIGVFVGLLVSFLALCVAETVGVKAGLGYYVKWQQGYADYAKVYGALVIMGVFFSGLLTLLFRLRDWALVWQKGVIKW
jgi:NitT/TauT family transport system permease protein